MAVSSCPVCGATPAQAAPYCAQCGAVLDAGAVPTATSPAGAGPEGPAYVRPGTAAHRTSGTFDHGRFTPGTILAGRYRIVGLAGRGGMGEVYRADDLQLGQPVALKFLPAAVEADRVRLERFVNEVRTARQVSHPNVCRVYDIGDADGRRFLSMEFVDGEDLRSLLRRIGRLPEDKALQIARQVAAGLAAMHDRGVLHRDLKPANVMLDGDGRVRLTDFGLATGITGAGSDGEIAGTPVYMAPEQLAGAPLSVQTDLYALGLLLYEIFTGERVHKDRTVSGARGTAMPREDAPPTPATGSGARLDPAVQRVIERCLEADPARRPASALAVSAALPGGDPLAAALAAGETPSPQMVAASGESGGLAMPVAGPLLAGLLVLLALFAWLNGRESYWARVPFPDSPDVLAAKAREMLVRLGHTEAIGDSGSGFASDRDLPEWIHQHPSYPLDRLDALRPPIVTFWHRTSPTAMVPLAFAGGTSGVPLSSDDPPLTTPGMTYLQLDPQGHLVRYLAVPSDHDASPASAAAPDWPRLFDEAGLKMAAFTPATPEWLGRVDADQRAAWVGPSGDASGSSLRVEAAARAGRPVFFRLVAPWTQPAGVTSQLFQKRTFALFLVGSVLLTMILATAVLFAVRNTRLGRADARGALRLALTSGLVTLLSGVIGSHYMASTSLWQEFFVVMSWSSFIAVMTWSTYTALEPYARRRWPWMLIAWTRLLEGRWRDPLVGRDLLIGSVVGVAITLCRPLELWVIRTRGGPPVVSWTDPAMGVSSAAVWLLDSVPLAIWIGLGLVLLLVVLRMVLRSERAAAIGLFAILAGPDLLTAVADPAIQIPLRLLADVGLILVATRVGLLAVVVYWYLFSVATALNVSFNFPAFVAGAIVIGFVAMLAPGVFGFFTAIAGRRSRMAGWLDE